VNRIVEIVHIEKRGDFYITHAIVDDGTEATSYDVEPYEEGDTVKVFFHDKYGRVKMKRITGGSSGRNKGRGRESSPEE